MRRRSIEQPLQMSDLNIVLLGLTGAGKSAAGNTIIGGDRKPFKEGDFSQSETKICTPAHIEVDERKITVIDTVGLSDTAVNISDLQTKIEQIFDCAHDGVDVFLLVIRLGDKFTQEVITAMKWIQDNFGAKVLKHTIVLFTHADQLHVEVEDHLSKCESLWSVVDLCSGGFHVFNNTNRDRSQVTELLDKINTLRRKNGFKRYTEQHYKETQDNILHRNCAIGAAVGAVGGALASYMGSVTTVGKSAVLVAATAVTAGVGVYCCTRKYTPKQKGS